MVVGPQGRIYTNDDLREAHKAPENYKQRGRAGRGQRKEKHASVIEDQRVEYCRLGGANLKNEASYGAAHRQKQVN